MSYLLQAHPLAWLLLVPVWAFVLRLLAGVFQFDVPSWPRAVTNVVLTGSVAFLAYDGTGFLFLQMFGLKYVEVPSGYGYARWMLESPLLKWEILSLVPGIRFLPIVFALCVGGILQVLMLLIPFRIGLIVFLAHWGVNLTLLAALGFLQMLILGEQSASWGFHSPASSALRLKPHPGLNRDTLKGVLVGMVPKTDIDAQNLPDGLKDTKSDTAKKKEKEKEPEAPADHPPQEPSLFETLQLMFDDAEPQLESLKDASHPILSRQPALEDKLNRGGWWLVLGVLGLFSVCWFFTMVKRIRRLSASEEKNR